MAHGSGGKSTDELIDKIFAKHFSNEILDKMEDSALVEGGKKMAFTTDSFVVDPVQFPGGNIGRLCICGTVNDLLMRGAIPKYLTCGFIIEEGADTDELEEIVKSMAETARESKVLIVAGDTKVVQGRGGMYINTSGIGFIPENVMCCPSYSRGLTLLNSSLYFLTRASRRSGSFHTQSRKASLIACCFCCASVVAF